MNLALGEKLFGGLSSIQIVGGSKQLDRNTYDPKISKELNLLMGLDQERLFGTYLKPQYMSLKTT